MLPIDSKIISLLRFPMIVGIVMIHSGITLQNDVSDYYLYNHLVVKGIIGTLTRLCVPLFFFISGYLFWANNTFNLSVYLRKLKKRVSSLLIPYIFYCTLAIILFAILNFLKPEIQTGPTPSIKDWNFYVILSMYWNMGDNLPIVPQFWFIRNLMVFILFAPIIYKLIKTFNTYPIFILGILWIINIGEFDIPGTMCLFWASLGGYFAIKNISISETIQKIKLLGYFYPLLAIIDIITKGARVNIYIHNLGIFLGVIFLWYISVRFLLNHPKYSPNKLLLSSTFFVFAMHEPYAGKIKTILWKMLPDLSINNNIADIQLIFYYFLWVTIWIAFLVLMFSIIKIIFPKLATFLSGGR